MDKDRDISRTIDTSRISPRKVGFVSSAVLAGSALVAACGGGAKSATTHEGGVAGAQVTPTGQATEIQTALPSATAVVKVPTVASTATVEAGLSPEQMVQTAKDVKQLFVAALTESPIKPEDFSKVNDFLVGSPYYTDMKRVSDAIDFCDVSNYGQPFAAVNLPNRTVQSSDIDYMSMFLGQCQYPAAATKVLFEASGNEKFKEANIKFKQIHKQVYEQMRKKDSRLGDWQGLVRLYYLPEQ